MRAYLIERSHHYLPARACHDHAPLVRLNVTSWTPGWTSQISAAWVEFFLLNFETRYEGLSLEHVAARAFVVPSVLRLQRCIAWTGSISAPGRVSTHSVRDHSRAFGSWSSQSRPGPGASRCYGYAVARCDDALCRCPEALEYSFCSGTIGQGQVLSDDIGIW